MDLDAAFSVGWAVPNCLGQIKKWHSEYCSSECKMAAICVLIVMDVWIKEYKGKS